MILNYCIYIFPTAEFVALKDELPDKTRNTTPTEQKTTPTVEKVVPKEEKTTPTGDKTTPTEETPKAREDNGSPVEKKPKDVVEPVSGKSLFFCFYYSHL